MSYSIIVLGLDRNGVNSLLILMATITQPQNNGTVQLEMNFMTVY